MPRKLSIEEAKSITLKKTNNKIELIEYNGSNSPAKFHCLVCGNIWTVSRANATMNGRGKFGCRKCSDKHVSSLKFYTNEQVQNILEDWGCQLLSEYVNDKELMEVVYKCGHFGEISLKELRKSKNKLCLDCKAKLVGKVKTKSEKEVIKEIESCGFKFIEFPDGYIDGYSKVSYSCSLGHVNIRKIYYFRKHHICHRCAFDNMSLTRTGQSNKFWNGGKTLKKFLCNHIRDWKKKIVEKCNGKCVITGKDYDNVHHIYGFNLILNQALKTLGLQLFENLNDYTQDQLLELIKVFQELHAFYPDGVCLCKEVHNLFHKIYGKGNNTPGQWYEFVSRIESGEIQIVA